MKSNLGLNITFKRPITREQAVNEWTLVVLRMIGDGKRLSFNDLVSYAESAATEIVTALEAAIEEATGRKVDPL
jgi:hypothetical protein